MAVFFDTNVLVYCTDTTTPGKQLRARRLVGQLAAEGEAVVSTQVLIELFYTLTRKQKMPPASAQALTHAYTAWPVVDSDVTLVNSTSSSRRMADPGSSASVTARSTRSHSCCAAGRAASGDRRAAWRTSDPICSGCSRVRRCSACFQRRSSPRHSFRQVGGRTA